MTAAKVIDGVFGDKMELKLMETLKGLEKEGVIEFNPAESKGDGFNFSFRLRKFFRDNPNPEGYEIRSRRWYVKKDWLKKAIKVWFEAANVPIKLK